MKHSPFWDGEIIFRRADGKEATKPQQLEEIYKTRDRLCARPGRAERKEMNPATNRILDGRLFDRVAQFKYGHFEYFGCEKVKFVEGWASIAEKKLYEEYLKPCAIFGRH